MASFLHTSVLNVQNQPCKPNEFIQSQHGALKNHYRFNQMNKNKSPKILLSILIFLTFVLTGYAQETVPGDTAQTSAPSITAQGEEVSSPDTAQVEEVVPLDSGNTAWMITATALVLFMTLPGLALFYGGLVQSKNVLSVLMHCFAVACLASILWVAVGYSLALTPG